MYKNLHMRSNNILFQIGFVQIRIDSIDDMVVCFWIK